MSRTHSSCPAGFQEACVAAPSAISVLGVETEHDGQVERCEWNRDLNRVLPVSQDRE